MSKSEEKSSKRKSKDVDASVTEEPKKEKKEKKDKKVKKEKKEKKEKKVEEESVEVTESTVTAPTTEDVAMESEESPVKDDTEAPEDSSIKKRKREHKSDTKDTKEEDVTLLEIDPDAPTPLSKAQARAARKEAKRKRKDGEADEEADTDGEEAGADGEPKPKKSKKDKDEAPKPPKRQHSVWIGNLAFKTNPESLKAWLEREIILLSKGGGPKAEATEAEVEDDDEPEEGDDDEVDEETEIVTRVNMPMKQGRFGVQNQGFAYVDFKTRRFQKLGVKLSEKMIDGRRLLIKYGDDYGAKADARTPKPVTSIPAGALPKSQPHNASATLFMGNLPFDATEEAIWDFVERNAQEALKGRKKSKKGKGRKVRFGEQDKSDSESESEEEEDEDKEEEVAEGDAKAILENKKQSSEVSGLRRVRMPLFEDSGKCKGFTFLDFKSVEQATLALANRRNHFLYNRKLKMQYASEGATKRSLPASQRNRPPPGEEGAEGEAPRPSGRYFDQGAPAPEGEEKKDARGKKWETAGRPKPGAALMMAKRESVAIVPGQGKKITF